LPEERVPVDEPPRAIQRMTDTIVNRMSPRFDRLYSRIGRHPIPPENLLRALLMQGLYTVRSERPLMEQLHSLLFGWFGGLSMDDPIWDATTFTKNRDRLLDRAIAEVFLQEAACASEKGFWRRDTAPEPPHDHGNLTFNLRGEGRKNDTHHSTTDPSAGV
jgi:transposase